MTIQKHRRHDLMAVPSIYTYARGREESFSLGSDELVTLAVHVDDLYRIIVFKMLTKLGDVNIHTTCIEVIVINPNGLKSEVALKDLILMGAKKVEEF